MTASENILDHYMLIQINSKMKSYLFDKKINFSK